MFFLDRIAEFISGLRQYNYTPVKHLAKEASLGVPFDIPLTARWKGIVWHHSATNDNPLAKDWDAIRRYHTSWRVNGTIVSEDEFNAASRAGKSDCEKPWSEIGYHLGIEREDGKLVVRMGRPWIKTGAHAGLPGNNSFNQLYLGCCLVGNFDAAPPDPEMMALCVEVTKHIMASLDIKKEDVLGHREVYDKAGVPRKKTCPGSSFDLELFRSKL